MQQRIASACARQAKPPSTPAWAATSSSTAGASVRWCAGVPRKMCVSATDRRLRGLRNADMEELLALLPVGIPVRILLIHLVGVRPAGRMEKGSVAWRVAERRGDAAARQRPDGSSTPVSCLGEQRSAAAMRLPRLQKPDGSGTRPSPDDEHLPRRRTPHGGRRRRRSDRAPGVDGGRCPGGARSRRQSAVLPCLDQGDSRSKKPPIS